MLVLMLGRDSIVTAIQTGEPVKLGGGARPSRRSFASDPDGSFAVQARTIRDVLLEAASDPDWPVDPRGLTMMGAYIVGELDLENLDVAHGLKFRNCLFGGAVGLAGARMAGGLAMAGVHIGGVTKGGWSLFAQGVQAGSGVFLDDGFQTAGAVNLSGAHINGQLRMSGAQLNGADKTSGWSLFAQGLEAESDALLDDGLQTAGPITLCGAHIVGQLRMSGAHLNGFRPDGAEEKNGWTLFAEGLRAESDVILNGAFKTSNAVSLSGAHIAGQLDMSDAQIRGVDGNGWSLYAQGMEAGSDVILDSRFNVAGAVSLSGAHIAGQLDMSGAHLNGVTEVGGWSLDAQGLRAGGDVALDTFETAGAVTLERVHVSGGLSMSGAKIRGVDKQAGWSLFADGLQADSDVFIDAGLETIGPVTLRRAHIIGRLRLTGAQLNGRTEEGGWSLFAQGLRADDGVFLDGKLQVAGTIQMAASQIQVLVVPADGELPALSSVSGWQLGDLYGHPRASRKVAAGWLKSQTTAQPWQQMADLYDRMGQPSDARWFRYRSAVRSTRQGPWWAKPGRGLYRITTGHGYYAAPLTLLWLLVIFAISWGLAGWQADQFTTATTSTIRVAKCIENRSADDVECSSTKEPASSIRGHVLTGEWKSTWDVPEFRAWTYATSNVLPASGTAQPWSPPPGWLTAVFAALRGLSWIFTALFLAGITGLLRKQT